MNYKNENLTMRKPKQISTKSKGTVGVKSSRSFRKITRGVEDAVPYKADARCMPVQISTVFITKTALTVKAVGAVCCVVLCKVQTREGYLGDIGAEIVGDAHACGAGGSAVVDERCACNEARALCRLHKHRVCGN